MTTIAYRKGVISADSRITYDSEAGGSRTFLCDKLFKKLITVDGAMQECIIATAGESSPGMIFVDWYDGTIKDPPAYFMEGGADFTCLVLRQDGLWEFDAWCRGIKIKDEFYAIGSGAKAALGAMHMGASAYKAVEIACRIDPYSAPPIIKMVLSNAKRKAGNMPKVPKGNDQRVQDARGKAAVGMRDGEGVLLQHNVTGDSNDKPKG